MMMMMVVMIMMMICSAFELHGGGSGYVDYKQLEVDPSHKLSVEIGFDHTSSYYTIIIIITLLQF